MPPPVLFDMLRAIPSNAPALYSCNTVCNANRASSLAPTPGPLPAAEGGDGASAAAAASPGSVVVYANELEYFGDTSTGSIKRWESGSVWVGGVWGLLWAVWMGVATFALGT